MYHIWQQSYPIEAVFIQRPGLLSTERKVLAEPSVPTPLATKVPLIEEYSYEKKPGTQSQTRLSEMKTTINQRNLKNKAGAMSKGSFIYYVRNIFRKTFQGVRNVSFSENVAYLINEWYPII